MENRDKYSVSEQATVGEAIYQMEKNAIKAVVVVNESKIMRGLFTLGDMRHFFLHGGKLADNIKTAMNSNPIVFSSTYDAEVSEKKLIVYPVVGEDGKLITVIDGQKPVINNVLENIPVVIMAGGKGTRLQPFTNVLPKALIPVGEVTITERIIELFYKFGSRDYHMVLNHKAGMIKAYFGEMKKDYRLSFVKEERFLGTGGGLYYLKDRIRQTFFLTNCDILVHADLECIYNTHKKNKNTITIVSAMKKFVIPYGVIHTGEMGGAVSEIEEKPEFSYLTNTGMYIMEPEVMAYIKENEFVHMPEIISRVLKDGKQVGTFPISEKSWLDMGQFSELERMYKELGLAGKEDI